MKLEAIINRVAQERWDMIASDTNERMGGIKIIQTWSELPANEKSWKAGHIEHILTAAGFFDLLDAAKEVYDDFGYLFPLPQKHRLREVIAKATGETP